MIFEIGPEKIALDFDPDMKLKDLVKSGKNIILFNFGLSLNKQIRPNDSWCLTKDHQCDRNV